MDMSIATAAVGVAQSSARQNAQMSMLKTAHEAEGQIVQMLAEAAASVPEGMGAMVDRKA